MFPMEGTADLICKDCIHEMFSTALEKEHNWPVTWGRWRLHPRNFPGVFDASFLDKYSAKEREYKTPALRRVYCSVVGGCGKFVGEVDEMASPEMVMRGFATCECEHRWCLLCGFGWGKGHKCKPRGQEGRVALDQLVKGKDYQICPEDGCGRIIELSEACNAMRCRCGVDFCYLCGEKAREGSPHWNRKADGTGCPKYGNKESGMFEDDMDQPPEEADGDEELIFVEPWPHGQGRMTTFNFQRWGWALTMQAGVLFREQLRVMRGQNPIVPNVLGNRDINLVLVHMMTLTPTLRAEVNNMQWNAIIETQDQWDVTRNWLRRLWQTARDRGDLRAMVGGSLLDIPPRHIFNVANRANVEAGGAWARRANSLVLANPQGVPEAIWRDVGVAVFDVGPDEVTAVTPAEYNIRDMNIFDRLDELSYYRLGGNALMVWPRWRIADDDAEHGQVEDANPVRDGERQPEQQAAEGRNHQQLLRLYQFGVRVLNDALRQHLARNYPWMEPGAENNTSLWLLFFFLTLYEMLTAPFLRIWRQFVEEPAVEETVVEQPEVAEPEEENVVTENQTEADNVGEGPAEPGAETLTETAQDEPTGQPIDTVPHFPAGDIGEEGTEQPGDDTSGGVEQNPEQDEEAKASPPAAGGQAELNAEEQQLVDEIIASLKQQVIHDEPRRMRR